MASIYDKASLVLIPSGTKTSKVYSQKPVSGDGDFTFSRSTAATRVNADGNIEKETQNLLTYSNTFTSWSNIGGTMVGGQSGYDGSNDAYLFTMSSGANICSQTNTESGVQTLSLYAKGSVSNGLRMYAFGSKNVFAYFDLNIGAVENTNQVIDANIEDVGGGWYRCSMTFEQSNTNIYMYLSNNNNSNAGSGSIYIQDAQLEQGLVARDYIETTTSAVEGGITDNVPRLDYTDSSCPALLLEPQRTNSVSQSEFYGGSDWGRTRCGFVTNTSETLSPEGLYNASKMTSTDASESYAQNDVVLGSTSGTYTFFAKKGDLDYCHALVWDRAANGRRQWFNLATGAVGTTTNFGSGYTKVDATIEDYGNGWYRCSFSWSGGNTTSGVRINISSGDGVIGSPVNSYGYFYGAQVEAGVSYPTSYIPTYGTSVTRNADNCEGDSSGYVSDTSGSLFWQGELEYVTGTDGHAISMSNSPQGAGTNRLLFYINNSTGNYQVYVQGGGSAQYGTPANLNVQSTDTNDKLAMAWSNNDFVVYVNGTQAYTSTSGSAPTGMDYIQINEWNGNNANKGKTMKALYFAQRLTNEELADLTS